MPKIHLPQKNLILEVHAGANLMKTLLDAGIPVASSCLGDGICGKCRLMTEGEVSKITPLESDTLLRNRATPTERLSCQITVTTDLILKSSYW
ncbi:MAG: hypothetical protein A2622_06695 [Bdellovibrionales bacterium RIFCSPHIGHO2_01_FULL_40_29]|nr:MAG: hypothetical protein A2622_06695 [Bdellovibrionales bacterium RIFCSPHIGHO2_01_FULL_40_29]OFZ35128.1 MAG: hypothetical protein A3D17_07045 [Bdellovibrionales bacterium RIFCSPHIGHO2_02_FULL_40_15]